jgi:hypothetical protein
MTVVTVVAARNMRRVFSRRGGTVMAGPTGSNYLRVINRNRWLKGEGAMTVFADISCLYVSHALANSSSAVVARYAVSSDTRMIESRG